MQKLNWHKIDIPKEDGIHGDVVDGKRICIIVKQDQITITSRRCPHAGADLAQGWCEEGKLVCPFHRHKFNLQTGRGDAGQGNYIDIYKTKFEDNCWYVGLPQPWWKRLFST